MDNTELINKLAKSLNTTKRNTREAVNTTLAIMTEHLARGEGISISRFDSLTVRLTPGRRPESQNWAGKAEIAQMYLSDLFKGESNTMLLNLIHP